MVSDQLVSLIVLLFLVLLFLLLLLCAGYLFRICINSNDDVFLRLPQGTLGSDNSLGHHLIHN